MSTTTAPLRSDWVDYFYRTPPESALPLGDCVRLSGVEGLGRNRLYWSVSAGLEDFGVEFSTPEIESAMERARGMRDDPNHPAWKRYPAPETSKRSTR